MNSETMPVPMTGESGDVAFGPHGEVTDRTLVSRVRAGDPGAYELLVRRHQSFLFRYARWMGMDEDTAADMVQDAFIRAYERISSCRNPERFGGWVGRILRNACLDYLKSAARRSVPLAPGLRSDFGDPEREEARSRLRKALRDALDRLPAEQREAFLMKHAEGLSYEEMAEMTTASLSAMKMRVHRAREVLRAELRGFLDDM